MQTMEEFLADFMAVQEGIARDYPELGSACHMMHRDLGLNQTTDEGSETAFEAVREAYGDEVGELAPESLDFTKEHRELHALLAQIRAEAMIGGVSPDQLIATIFIIGRRMGMKEAADMLTPPIDNERAPGGSDQEA